MPANCSADISRVVDHIDSVYASGDQGKQQELKEMFGLGGLEYYDDFAGWVCPSSPMEQTMNADETVR